jgi:glyoxylase-like metal-dependent hydrolase (beta-lactamase superfamily II)
VLQVISVPGHTPESIALWDAKNGLLFTGDMYYPGPIFLFRPETDLDAYEASIAKMIALHAKLLLPAHNLPVADPADLPRVLTAMKQARSGKIKPVKGEHWVEYRFEGFSFLMQR